MIFFIEDINGERFGLYYDKKCKSNNNSFHFNLKSNNRLKYPMKFEFKNNEEDTTVLFEEISNIFSIGDIQLIDEKGQYESLCIETSETFDYHGIENALCGDTVFKSKRFIIFQMKMQEQQIEEERKELIDQFEIWTKLTFKKVIFDSIIDNFDDLTIFNERISGKSKLFFVIEDIDDEIFGYYLDNEITNPKVGKCFHFNFNSNGRLNGPMKFQSINPYDTYGSYIRKRTDDTLIKLGDIHLMKSENWVDGECLENSEDFNYNNERHSLCGKHLFFHVYKLVVIQME